MEKRIKKIVKNEMDIYTVEVLFKLKDTTKYINIGTYQFPDDVEDAIYLANIFQKEYNGETEEEIRHSIQISIKSTHN